MLNVKCQISQEIEKIFNLLKEDFHRILGNHLVGIYAHGSIALNDFDFEKSDIDLLVVTKKMPTLSQKEGLIQSILQYQHFYPKKGIEISFVQLNDCGKFIDPTPFDLHFSNLYLEEAKKDTLEFAKKMHGVDCDLACHFTLTREMGITIFGPSPKDIFMPVPRKYYLQSILADLEDGKNMLLTHPDYVISNLCRTLAYLEDHIFLSKQQGITWIQSHHYPFSELLNAIPKERTNEIYETYMELIHKKIISL